jgi:hypothetical protein
VTFCGGRIISVNPEMVDFGLSQGRSDFATAGFAVTPWRERG